MTIRGIGAGGLPPAYQAAQRATPRPPATVAPARQEVPPGSDPKLWAILTSDEKAFFLRQQALGPLRYGPTGAASPAAPAADAPRGLRLDVRA